MAPSDATQVSGITESTQCNELVAREGLMLKIYSNTMICHNLNSHDKTNISETTKKHLLGKLKFIQTEKNYPSFWQPNLLYDTPSYVDALFDSYGLKYKDRKSNDVTLSEATELWKAAATMIKKIVDNHRAAVAQKMKIDVMTGKTNI